MASTVGIVVVSHSSALAEGLVELAREMAGPAVPIEPAGGRAGGGLGTDADRVRDAIARAGGGGGGVVVLGDLGSSILTVRHLLERRANGHVRLADAPFVEGAVTAAVAASAGAGLDDVVAAAEGARGARKL
ncbi:MAG TPA: dihydroxyacetone kinase phosphoryl donor subunit DhaM [Solirubrobacteraceae bacterium]|jgi:dihydroxyacetone kinase phosphotransfer subunit